MKRFINGCVIFLGLTACAGCAGTSKKDQLAALQFVNDRIEESKTVDCNTIHDYLATVQTAVQEQMAKLK